MSKPIEITITIPEEDAVRIGLADFVRRNSTSAAGQEWVSPKEAATILGVSVDKLYQLIHDGAVVSKKIGSRNYRVLRESLT